MAIQIGADLPANDGLDFRGERLVVGFGLREHGYVVQSRGALDCSFTLHIVNIIIVTRIKPSGCLTKDERPSRCRTPPRLNGAPPSYRTFTAALKLPL